MRRRSSGSAAEEEGENSPSNADVVGAGGEEATLKKDSSQGLQTTSRQSHPQNSAHELDRRKSTDQRPSTARSRLPSQTNWKSADSRDGQQIEKKKSVESAIIIAPSKEAIAVDNMPDSRTRSQIARRSKLRSPWSLSLLVLVTTTIASLCLFAIIHSFTSRQLDTKGCRMSYETVVCEAFRLRYGAYTFRKQILSLSLQRRGRG